MSRIQRGKDILIKTAGNWSEDNVPRLAAAFSFYAVLSVAPVLVLAVTVGSIFLKQQEAKDHLLDQVGRFIGSNEVKGLIGDLIEKTQKPGSGTIAAIVSFLVTFFSASNLFLQLEDTVNTIWGIKQKGSVIRNLITTRLLAFTEVVVFGGLLLGWLGLDSWLSWLTRHTDGFNGWPFISFVVTAIFFTGALGIAYKGMPKGRVQWGDVWPGAVASGFGVAASKLAFSAYFAYANVSAAYGAAGSLIVLLLWIYYTSQIFFFGLEMTYTYAKEYGSLTGQHSGDLEYS